MERLKLRHVDDTEFVEVDIPAEAACVGKTLSELARLLPRKAVIVSIRRTSGQVIIAHGDTRLEVGDRVEAFIHNESKSKLFNCLLGKAQ